MRPSLRLTRQSCSLKALHQQSQLPLKPSPQPPNPSLQRHKSSPSPAPLSLEKALTTAELLAAERANDKKEAPVRSTETFAADLLNPPTLCPAAAAALALPWLASKRWLAVSRARAVACGVASGLRR